MAPRIKQLIHEIHRRSLWQVTTIYVGGSWFVLEVTDQVIERFLLPEWVYGATVILLLVGLPIVVATAFVHERPASDPQSGRAAAPEAATESTRPASAGTANESGGLARKLRILTWPKAILGGVLAFTVLGIASAYIVLRGTARVTEAYGAAGDAFGERGWIVVTDFEAPEGEEDIALAAREALTIDLEQSEYVNVYSRQQIAPVLQRMSLPDTLRLDQRLALEVAERQGLAAVLAGRVNRLGDDYQFIARVIQPGTGRELIGVRTAAHADRTIQGVEALSREVRSRLGEERAEIRLSRPLPEVTTTSLEALKLYARAVTLLTDRHQEMEAIPPAREAVRLDTAFAMAYRLLSVANANIGRFGDAQKYATRAYVLRDGLSDVERLHVEGLYHMVVTSDYRQATDTYERLLSRYPDDVRGAINLGAAAWLAGDIERAYLATRRALELAPTAISYDNAIEDALLVHQWAAADTLMALAHGAGLADPFMRHRIGRAFSRYDLARADQLCDSSLALGDGESFLANRRQLCGSIDVARGRLSRGVERLEAAARYYRETRQAWDLAQCLGTMMVADQLRDRRAAATAKLDAMLERVPADSLGEQDRFYASTELRIYAGALGRSDLVDRIAAAYPAGDSIVAWQRRYGDGLVTAAGALARGDPTAALDALNEGTRGDDPPIYWRAERHLLYGLALDGIGAADSAIIHLEAVVDSGLVADWLVTPSRAFLPTVELRLAELEEARGSTSVAIEHYRRFLDLWSDADPELGRQVEAARRALTRLTRQERT